jgi:hypothetical protein
MTDVDRDVVLCTMEEVAQQQPESGNFTFQADVGPAYRCCPVRDTQGRVHILYKSLYVSFEGELSDIEVI